MVSHQNRTDQIFDLAAGQTPPGEFPEFALVVAEDPDLPEDIAKQGQTKLDIPP